MKPPVFRHAAPSAAAAFLIVYVPHRQLSLNRAPKSSTANEPIKAEPTILLSEAVPDLQGIWTEKWIVDMSDGRFAEKTVEIPFTD
jgi:hypothetical protein